MRQHLILFARAPQRGTGKRRLAREIGDGRADRFERIVLARLLRRLGRDRRWQLHLAVTPDAARHRRRQWPRGATVDGQGPGDIGTRMHRALAQHPPGPAVLIGSDIPDITAAHITAAFRLLGGHDLVFGPADDGGFWLVGARRRPRLPPLFGPVRWSGPHALSDTLGNLPHRVSAAFAPRLADVDDGHAYQRFIAGLPISYGVTIGAGVGVGARIAGATIDGTRVDDTGYCTANGTFV